MPFALDFGAGLTILIAMIGGIYTIMTRLIVGPMIDKGIATLMNQLDDRYQSKETAALIVGANEAAHERILEELREFRAELNQRRKP